MISPAVAAAGAAAAAAAPTDGFPSSKTLRPHPSSSSSSVAATASSTASESSGSDDEAPAAGTTPRNDDDASLREHFDEGRVDRMNRRAARENEELNLNLGLPVDLTVYARRDDDDAGAAGAVQKMLRPPIRILIRLFDKLLSLIESPLFRLWGDRVPLRVRQRMTFLAWGMYLPIHKALIGRRTGLHKDASLEYHALTTVMWWGRLFPITIKRMRFSLSQLHVWHPPDRYPRWNDSENDSPSSRDALVVSSDKPRNGERHGIRGHLHEVYHRMDAKRTPTGFRGHAPNPTGAEMTVTGKYVQHASRPSRKVVFWIFGGAFLAGDSTGNVGIAEKMGMRCGDPDGGEGGDGDGEGGMRDVFVPDHRLVPENHLDDALHDIALAYEYLVYERGTRPENITLVGVSSGSGLAVLLLQALARARREFERREEGAVDDGRDDGGGADDGSGRCVPMPAGAVLMGPFVDYTEPRGTMREYIRHDLIVNQAVYDEGIPYLETVLGSHEDRLRASPCYGNMEGLPPLCVCVSEHEVVYDQAMLLARRAKEKGVDVTVGVWKYMCHVFQLLCPFIPEGEESFEFMCEWIRRR